MQTCAPVRLTGNRTDARTQFLALPETGFQAGCSKLHCTKARFVSVGSDSGLRYCRLLFGVSFDLSLVVGDRINKEVIVILHHRGWWSSLGRIETQQSLKFSPRIHVFLALTSEPKLTLSLCYLLDHGVFYHPVWQHLSLCWQLLWRVCDCGLDALSVG